MTVSELEREIEKERRETADLQKVLATVEGKIRQLAASVESSLAESDVQSLEDQALAQAQADVELAAQRRVEAELRRRIGAKQKRLYEVLIVQLNQLRRKDLQAAMDELSDRIMDHYAAVLPMLDQMLDLDDQAYDLTRSRLTSDVPGRLRKDQVGHAVEVYYNERKSRTPAPVAAAKPSSQSVLRKLIPASAKEDGEWTNY